MQQVVRSMGEKRRRDRLRAKISSLTPHQYSLEARYFDNPVVPHEVLAHQFRHLAPYRYNKLEQISARQVYPLSEALVYEPLRYNQLQEQYQRSKSLLEGNEFLNSYSEKEHGRRREEYFSRIRAAEQVRREEEQARADEILEKKRMRERKMRQSAVLPPIRPETPTYNPRFRAAAIAVYFVCLARARVRGLIEWRRERCEKGQRAAIRAAMEAMQAFYYGKVEREITQYILLLEKKLKYGNYRADDDLLPILTSLFTKINSLPLPAPLLTALVLICPSYSAFPFPFLFTEELKRLPFMRQQGCSGSLSREESLMLGACFLVVKLWCVNLFFRPWLVQDLFRKHQERHVDLRAKYGELRRIINHMGSLPYFIAVDSFLLDCPALRSQSEIEQLAKDGIVTTVPFMSVLPREMTEESPMVMDSSDEEQLSELGGEGVSGASERETQVVSELVDEVNLVAGQNRGFYLRMRQSHPQEMEQLELLITEWVTKATLAALHRNANEKRQRTRTLS